MAIPSNGSTHFPRSQRQTYDWRTFCMESLYGLLTIAWYLLALVEMFMLKGLTQLGKCLSPSSADLSEDGGRHNELLEPASKAHVEVREEEQKTKHSM